MWVSYVGEKNRRAQPRDFQRMLQMCPVPMQIVSIEEIRDLMLAFSSMVVGSPSQHSVMEGSCGKVAKRFATLLVATLKLLQITVIKRTVPAVVVLTYFLQSPLSLTDLPRKKCKGTEK